ncbi:MAG: hypothetical protein HKN77_10850, partial [Woeseiaceae bacterium]|nr:hypothetical protein [Woeseiaceae bacterium]
TASANGDYYNLVKAFAGRTGVPILLNTSLNVMGEPVAETPDDALWCLLLTELDACVFDSVIVTKKPGYRSLADLHPYFLVSKQAVYRPPSGDGLIFKVTTPWGPYSFGLRDESTVAILELLLGEGMDGGTAAGAIFERIRQKLGPRPDSELIRLFAQFRRWRLISFREAPAGA